MSDRAQRFLGQMDLICRDRSRLVEDGRRLVEMASGALSELDRRELVQALEKRAAQAPSLPVAKACAPGRYHPMVPITLWKGEQHGDQVAQGEDPGFPTQRFSGGGSGEDAGELQEASSQASG